MSYTGTSHRGRSRGFCFTFQHLYDTLDREHQDFEEMALIYSLAQSQDWFPVMVEWVADVKKPVSNLLLRQQIEQFKSVEWTRQTGSWHFSKRKKSRSRTQHNMHIWAELALLVFTKPYESKINLLGQPSDSPNYSFLIKIQFKKQRAHTLQKPHHVTFYNAMYFYQKRL